MGAVSEILGVDAAPHTIEYKGRTYTFSLINQTGESSFEKALLELKKRKLEDTRSLYSPEEYSAKRDALVKAYEDGDFDILREENLKFLVSRPGLRFILTLITGCHENELIGLMTERSQDVLEKVYLVLKESFPGVEFKMPKPGEKPAPTPEASASGDSSKPPGDAVPN